MRCNNGRLFFPFVGSRSISVTSVFTASLQEEAFPDKSAPISNFRGFLMEKEEAGEVEDVSEPS